MINKNISSSLSQATVNSVLTDEDFKAFNEAN